MNPILFIVALVLVIYFLGKTMFCRPKHFPPGPSLWFPYYGHYLSILLNNYRHTHQALGKMCDYYRSKVLGLYLGPFPTVVASDEKSIKELLMRPEFQGRIDQVVSLLRVDYGEERGIIFTEGDLWQQQKRFFLRHMRDYGFGKRSPNLEAELTAEIQDLITFLREEKDHPLYRNGEARIPTLFALGNLNLLLQALTGERFKGREGKEFLSQVHEDTLNFQHYSEPCASTLTFVPWAKYLPPFSGHLTDLTALNDNLAKYAKDSMYKRMSNFNEDKISCAVDAYIKEMKTAQENGDTETHFTEDQLKLVIQDFTFTSSNTVSGQLGFLWQQFILNPEVQTKIQEEIDTVVGRDELPNLNHRKDLHYTEATIREILRYKTLVPLAVPHRSTEDADFMGYHTEKGTIMITNLYKMHMNPEVWGDPENFRPERFLDQKGHLKKKDQTLPFGIGKRLCPGETFARQNMFMYVTGLLQNFTFSLPKGAKIPDDSDYLPGINVHPKHMWLQVTPRK
uniref:Probable cytochrome P450 304a1 n=3 Tax=Cacopsylla melanoneura TaxID=428564 RepID=A0A8D8VAC1_9HEMI